MKRWYMCSLKIPPRTCSHGHHIERDASGFIKFLNCIYRLSDTTHTFADGIHKLIK